MSYTILEYLNNSPYMNKLKEDIIRKYDSIDIKVEITQYNYSSEPSLKVWRNKFEEFFDMTDLDFDLLNLTNFFENEINKLPRKDKWNLTGVVEFEEMADFFERFEYDDTYFATTETEDLIKEINMKGYKVI